MDRAWDGRRAAWAWAALGASGSLLVALAGPRLAEAGWWFHLHISRLGAEWMHYAGLVLMCAAWLGLGLCLRAVSGRGMWAIGLLWGLPVLFGPVLFSHDVYSYIAQGDLLRLGLDPYKVAPAALAAHGQGPVVGAVSPFWRHTTAPYGPLFLALVSPVSALAKDHHVLAALIVKVLDALGLVLLGVFVPRLARAVGTNPRRAAWLAVLSPLVLLQIVAAGHNDGLMAGLMVAGVALALEGKLLPAVALCAVAAMIKLPAAAACVFIAVAAARSEPDGRAQVEVLLRAAAAFVAVVVVVSIATTVGTEWISTGVFSSPGKTHLALTPAIALGYTTASILHDLGDSGARTLSVESAFVGVAGALVVLIALWLLWRVRRPTLVRDIGIVLLAAAIGGPAAWPWYLIWGLALLSSWPAGQRSLWIVVAVTLPVFLIRPGGIALPPRNWSPIVVGVYAALALVWLLWRRWRGGARRPVPALT